MPVFDCQEILEAAAKAGFEESVYRCKQAALVDDRDYLAHADDVWEKQSESVRSDWRMIALKIIKVHIDKTR